MLATLYDRHSAFSMAAPMLGFCLLVFAVCVGVVLPAEHLVEVGRMPARSRRKTVISCGALKPILLSRDGVRLAHVEAGPAAPRFPPLLLINGWTGDHGIFTPQISHFSQSRRVVAVNIRGHGASDAPAQEYTIAGFAC
ncbi:MULTISPECIES: alpha/beta fold hydrolase [Bradyrhizobium]|uniref:alpha/beta fold hydrolase n=1 Tax=Bradyrhizobium TaxID=374 RepID=UPI001E550289|nr:MULTISPECIES: alpha/beta fold hydrolase [Bradyrhizobium]